MARAEIFFEMSTLSFICESTKAHMDTSPLLFRLNVLHQLPVDLRQHTIMIVRFRTEDPDFVEDDVQDFIEQQLGLVDKNLPNKFKDPTIIQSPLNGQYLPCGKCAHGTFLAHACIKKADTAAIDEGLVAAVHFQTVGNNHMLKLLRPKLHLKPLGCNCLQAYSNQQYS